MTGTRWIARRKARTALQPTEIKAGNFSHALPPARFVESEWIGSSHLAAFSKDTNTVYINPVRIVLDPDATPVAKGKLCGQQAGFNLHAQTKVAANDKKGRENLCKYILRPPLANDRLKILDDGHVRLPKRSSRCWR